MSLHHNSSLSNISTKAEEQKMPASTNSSQSNIANVDIRNQKILMEKL